MRKAKIAFIGGGNMARSLIAGLVKDEYPPHCIWVVDRNRDKCDALSQVYDVHTLASIEEAALNADIIILAVKPFAMSDVAHSIGSIIKQRQPLVISVAAGLKLEDLEVLFGEKTAIVRAMPNTPSLISCGAAGLFANDATSEAQKNLAEQILRAVGAVVWVKKESLIDTVTALSGSGPAYVFAFMEAMEKAAIDMGLNEKQAHLLALQTTYGAARMAMESNESLTSLRERVTSKGGTTAAALQVFADKDLAAIVSTAMLAAKDRGVEISKQLHTRKQLQTDPKKTT